MQEKKEKTSVIYMRLPADTVKSLKIKAKEMHMDVSTYIRLCLLESMKHGFKMRVELSDSASEAI